MKATAIRIAGLTLALLLGAPAWAHGSHEHAKKVCKKDGKVIKVKGKTNDDKRASCEAKGGTWEDSDDE